MIPKQSHVYNEFAILYWFMLQCIFCVSYLVSRRAEIDRTEFWASCAETNTWTLFVLRCLFSNHNLIHLLTRNGVVLCYAIFLFFCCAMQNNHLMKVWASIRRLMLLHPTANEKIHYSSAGLHIYILMTKPKQKCKLKANITLWENLHGGAKTIKGHLFTFMSFPTFIIFFLLMFALLFLIQSEWWVIKKLSKYFIQILHYILCHLKSCNSFYRLGILYTNHGYVYDAFSNFLSLKAPFTFIVWIRAVWIFC